MAIHLNNAENPSAIYYNNTEISKVYYNGELVWESYREITVLDMDNDIPTGITTYPESGDAKAQNTRLCSDHSVGSSGGSIEPFNMSYYEIGMTQLQYYPQGGTYQDESIEPYPNNIGFWLHSDYRNADKTNVDITKYNTCLVEAYIGGGTYPFDPGTLRIANHNYVMFTMLNNTELRENYIGNWVKVSEEAYYGYSWDWDNLFPNNSNHLIPYDSYDAYSGNPKPDWWSEVPWNHKIGFGLHTWHDSNDHQGFQGPIGFRNIENFRTYGQPVKFSIRGLTGSRHIRALLLPFSCGKTNNGGDVYLWKVTLNTNICDPND